MGDVCNLKRYESDVVIIGSGIGGLYSALNLSSKHNTIVLTKSSTVDSNSCLAQGGVAASFDANVHFEDTIKAGAYYNNVEAVKTLVDDSLINIKKLVDYGVNFDRDERGNLKVTCEGGHTQKHIIYAKDSTGKVIIQSLIREVEERTNIEVKERVFAVDLLVKGNAVVGVLAISEVGEMEIYLSKAVVIATGGIGQIYEKTTNTIHATGDGIAMAYRAGAEIKDMEFVQFHPTAFYDGVKGQKFLISEAVRGEGGVLKNVQGDAFMNKYSVMGDLAPRDIVSQCVYKEISESNIPYVYLDISHKSTSFIKDRFPMIYNTCIEKGIDITKEKIPIAPAEHYLMGGIKTNTDGKTSIEGLYACGESACTGVHGANRLASNSLLECLVYGNRVANSINIYTEQREKPDLDNSAILELTQTFIEDVLWDADHIQKVIKSIMDKRVSVVRLYEGLKDASKIFMELEKMLIKPRVSINSIKHIETINMITVASLVTKAALNRQESLGCHYYSRKINNYSE